jgi:beta-aspartyl-peptidase (threonine type)
MSMREGWTRLGGAAALPILLLGAPAAGAGERGGRVEKVVLAVHGGAGDLPRDKTSPELIKRREGIERALRAGYRRLEKGGTSLDAVEAAIRVLEDDPWFNAGKGAVFTHEMRNELDASIMEGQGKKAGAVAGVTVIKNPITAARTVMEKSKHVLLAGRGAELFALKMGLEIVDPSYFRTEHRLKELQEELRREKQEEKAGRRGSQVRRAARYFGTVGAVARDRDGNLAAGTSTGGMTNKMGGRVGDSPIIGAGTYADNAACAVSCTGHGEVFIRYAVAHDVAARMKYGQASRVDEAVRQVIKGLPDEPGGVGGAIALDARGNLGVSFTTERMYRGYVTSDGKVHVIITEERP